jgi:hypothetical protein
MRNYANKTVQAEQLVLESLSSVENLLSSPSFTHTKTPNDATFTFKVGRNSR